MWCYYSMCFCNEQSIYNLASNWYIYSKIEEVDPEQAKVNTILQDPELREILMDPGMQRVLMECSDPVKFRNHMLNKETARKLHKLKQAGLVQVEM